MIREEIKKLTEKAIKKLQKKKVFLKFDIPKIKTEHPEEKTHGDYATNIAMVLAKRVKKNPIEIAEIVTESLSHLATESLLDKVEVAKPGFINFFLSKEFLQKQIEEILKKGEKFGQLEAGKNQKIQVEFISANPTGPLTVGNARGGPFGDVLANVLKKAGFRVEKAYYVNDYGMQILTLGHSVLKDKEVPKESKLPTGQAKYKGEYIDYLNKKIKEKNPYKAGEIAAKIIIKEMIKKIPIRIYLFDIVYVDGKNLTNESYETRRKELEKIIKPIKNKFELSHALITKNLKEAEKFYKESLKEKQEGLMVKNLQAKYQPGRRVGQWLKVKPILEPLDLAIIRAEHGTGKRLKWFGSFTLGCLKESQSNQYLPCGKIGTGLTDEEFEELTKRLKPLIIQEEGREVKLRPEVIIEVAYEEIQKSPKYESGYALRFPRLIRFKNDRNLPNELEKLERLFKQQFKSKK